MDRVSLSGTSGATLPSWSQSVNAVVKTTCDRDEQAVAEDSGGSSLHAVSPFD